MASMGRTPEQIGALIRLHRKRLGLSQAALGMRTGLRQATVSLMESGNPACRLDTLLAVLSALDLELQIGARTRNRDLADLVD